MLIRDAMARDAGAIAAIYNSAVRDTSAIWNDQEVDAANRRAWLSQRQGDGFVVLVLEKDGDVLGYASYGAWRAYDGYKQTVENSVYVRNDSYGLGIGRLLLEALIERAKVHKMHIMIAGIDGSNDVSMALHKKLGFVESGRLPQVGQKFGQWLDLVFMSLKLDDRELP